MTKNKFPDLNDDDFDKIREIQECMRTGTCRKYDKKSDQFYCTFFTVTNQRRRLDCSLRYESTVDVVKGEEGIFSHKLPYYRCHASQRRGDGVIVSE